MNKKIFFPMLLCSLLPGCSFLGGQGNTVSIAKSSKGFELHLNAAPYYVQGVGLGEAFGKKGENYLVMAKELGANTVRTWGVDQGTKKYLDEAHRQGLNVVAGIWIDHVDAKKTFSYLRDDGYRKKKEKEALDYVRRFKGHPAVLAWGVGNECIFFTKDEDERVAMCRFMDDLTKKIKKLDPRHPVLYASVNSLDLPYLKKYFPSLDIVGMNVYGSIVGSQSGWKALDFGKPYVITEFGPLGPWDTPKDSHGKMIELDDYTKAQQYRNHWSLIKERRGDNVGGFVFHLGETTQESLTQWNINDHQYRKQPFIVMQRLFGAQKVKNDAPKLARLDLPEKVGAGQEFPAEITAAEPEGSGLTYEFKASTSTQDVLQYYVNVEIPIEARGTGPKVTLVAPSTPGLYRVYGFARDQAGNSGSLSRILQVD